MNLSVNPMGQNFNNRNSVNFGMAIKLDNDALPIIKEQASKLSKGAYEEFWKNFDAAVSRQQENPVNIIVRKCNNRRALAAEIVDKSENPLDNQVFTQGFGKKGLKFLDKAEVKADNINDMNQRLGKYDLAIDDDYNPGTVKELDIEV